IVRPGDLHRRRGMAWAGDLAVALTLVWWLLLLATLVTLIVGPQHVLALALDPGIGAAFITLFALLAVVWLVFHLSTATLALRAAREASGRPSAILAVATVTAVAIIATSGVAAGAAVAVKTTRDAASAVFSQTPSPQPWNGRWNIALLGGDAGADREGRRIDSVNVLSLDLASGDAVVISVPRGLQHVPLTEDSPLREIWPSGIYDCGH